MLYESNAGTATSGSDGPVVASSLGPRNDEDPRATASELRSRTRSDETHCEQLRTNRSDPHDPFEGVIERGMLDLELDSDRTAEFLLAPTTDARTRHVATENPVAGIRAYFLDDAIGDSSPEVATG